MGIHLFQLSSSSHCQSAKAEDISEGPVEFEKKEVAVGVEVMLCL
jgi:hypothetical protein